MVLVFGFLDRDYNSYDHVGTHYKCAPALGELLGTHYKCAPGRLLLNKNERSMKIFNIMKWPPIILINI